MRELREVKGSDNFSNFPTVYKKDKERAKKHVLYVDPTLKRSIF